MSLSQNREWPLDGCEGSYKRTPSIWCAQVRETPTYGLVFLLTCWWVIKPETNGAALKKDTQTPFLVSHKRTPTGLFVFWGGRALKAGHAQIQMPSRFATRVTRGSEVESFCLPFDGHVFASLVRRGSVCLMGVKGSQSTVCLFFLLLVFCLGGEFLCATNGGNGLPGFGFVSVSLA